MKKNLHTFLTAAMFAAANVSAVPAAAESGTAVRPQVDPVEKISFDGENDNGWPQFGEKDYEAFMENIVTGTSWAPYGVYGPPAYFDLTTTTTTEPMVLYGPPWVFTTTTTTSEDEGTTTGMTTTMFEPWMTTTTTKLPQPAYGPPLQDFVGDVNFDGMVDCFDVLAVKKMLLKGTDRYSAANMEAYYADLNNDGKLTLADLVLLQKYLLGQVSKKELQEKYGYWYGSHDIEIEQIGSPVTDVTSTSGKKPTVTTTKISEFDPGSDIVISLYGIKPSIDIVREITEDSINKVKDIDLSEDK